MGVEQAALKFKRWAVENHLLRRGRDDRVPLDATPLFLEENANKAAAGVLRSKSISFVGYNRVSDAIIVYVRTRLTKADERRLINEVDGFMVVYRKGVPAAWNGRVNTPVTDAYVCSPKGLYTCGSSLFLASSFSAGTLGALVANQKGTIFGLSNNHVTGACNYAEVGHPILAPAPIDATRNTIDVFTIGRHFECAPMLDGLPENLGPGFNTDAAIFGCSDASKLSSLQRNVYDTPSAIGPLVENITVMKAGRTTGVTKGKVVAKAADYDAIDYEVPELNLKKTVYFRDIFSIESSGNQPFADLGDSGSLVVEVDGPGAHALLA